MLDSALLPLHDDLARLRPLEPGDAAAYAEGSADSVVQRFGHLPEREYTTASVRTMIDEHARPGLESGDLAVLCIATSLDEFAGSLVVFDVAATSAEVGFWLHPKYRGEGLATAALNLATQFVARSGITRLVAYTAVENVASQQVLSRAGFKQTGRTFDIAPSGSKLELEGYSKSIQHQADISQ